MKTAVISFTEKGLLLSEKLAGLFADHGNGNRMEIYAKFDSFSKTEHPYVTQVEEKLADWTLEKQKQKQPLVFVGAMGIAVRAIAEGIRDKLTDAPVIVMDETGAFVIPVLAGHMGGANVLATEIAEAIGAQPVITTATDLEGCFAVDLFAKENHLAIMNRDGIAKVSAKALEGRPVRISIENYPPKQADVVVTSSTESNMSGTITLCPREYAVGIGCRKGTSFEQLKEFVEETFVKLQIPSMKIGAIASVDLKEDEEGLIRLGHYLKVPFITYTADLLKQAAGEYEESDFVREQTGVGNVCERAAMLLADNNGEFILRKLAKNGMTIAVVKRRWV